MLKLPALHLHNLLSVITCVLVDCDMRRFSGFNANWHGSYSMVRTSILVRQVNPQGSIVWLTEGSGRLFPSGVNLEEVVLEEVPRYPATIVSIIVSKHSTISILPPFILWRSLVVALYPYLVFPTFVMNRLSSLTLRSGSQSFSRRFFIPQMTNNHFSIRYNATLTPTPSTPTLNSTTPHCGKYVQVIWTGGNRSFWTGVPFNLTGFPVDLDGIPVVSEWVPQSMWMDLPVRSPGVPGYSS
jgi:hypothetical protein